MVLIHSPWESGGETDLSIYGGNFVEQGRLEVDTKYFLFKRRIALIRTQGKKKYRNRQIFEGSKSEKMDAL